MKEVIQHILATKKTTIRKIMEIIDAAPHKGAPAGMALIVDESGKLLGVVTDGDIRRATLRGISLDSAVEEIMIKDPITVTKGLSIGETLDAVLKKVQESPRLRGSKVDKIVVVDALGRVEDVLSFFEIWRKSEIKTREVCIVGLGYVGLTLAASLADAGFRIIGIDHNKRIFEDLEKGKPHVYEAGLGDLLKYHLHKTFLLKPDLEKSESDVYIICVETPVDKRNKPITRYLEKAAASVGKVLKKDDLVVLRSTVPPGTSRNLVLPILERKSGLIGGKDFYLAFAPERTVEGKALEELRKLPQVIGGLDKISVELASKLFRELAPTIVAVDSLESAEMVKLVNNTFRDLTFAYANELALICNKLGLDVAKLIEVANEGYLRGNVPAPSPGVGGACLSKDPHLFIEAAKKGGYRPMLVADARKINERMPSHVAKKIVDFCKSAGKKPAEVKIFIIGFAFKGRPETSDTRFSPTIDLIKLLKRAGVKRLFGYDPVVPRAEVKRLGVIACDLKRGFEKTDCVVVMNNHESYTKINIHPLLNRMKKPGLFLDGWHIFSKETVARVEGIVYKGLSG